MASIFGHVIASTALGFSIFEKQRTTKTLLVAAFCAWLPDADIFGLYLGVPYDSPFGHRGASHSIVAAVLIGWLAALFFFKNEAKRGRLALFFIASALSHPLLDMLTDGGRGVALFFPFSLKRLFFPFRPIQVSPLRVGDFQGEWAMEVLTTEFVWIGLPAVGLVAATFLLKKLASFLTNQN